MKKYILLVLSSIVITLSLSAQEWGEIGTRWVYNSVAFQANQFVSYEVEKDTILENEACKKLTTTLYTSLGFGSPFGASSRDPIFLRESNDSIFWWDGELFKFIYSLKPQIGNEWVVPDNQNFTCINSLPETDVTTVTGVNMGMYGGIEIETYDITVGDNWNLGSWILKDIGPFRSPFPVPGINCGGLFYTSQGQPDGLFCYSTPSGGGFGWSSSSDFPSCEELTPVHDIFNENNRRDTWGIFPNPTENILYVRNVNGQSSQVFTMDIYNSFGQEVFSKKISGDFSVDLEGLPRGVYFLTISKENDIHNFETYKIIKK